MIQNIQEVDRGLVRKEVSQRFAKMLLKPTFYDPNERDKIAVVVEALSGGSRANIIMAMCPEMFTFHPNVTIDPIPASSMVRPSEAYGFTRLGMSSFMLRASTRNVKSCHGIEAPGRNHSLGQLRYMSNPFWACYGVYNGPQSKATLTNDAVGLWSNDDLTTPNLLSTANALLAYTANGLPAIMLSRVYGAYNRDAALSFQRLIDYFTYTLGLPVYAASRWFTEQSVYLGLLEMYKMKRPAAAENLYTPIIEPLVNLYQKVNAKVDTEFETFEYGKNTYRTYSYQPNAYADIPLPVSPPKDTNGTPNVMFERQPAYMIASPVGGALVKFLPLPQQIKEVVELCNKGVGTVENINMLFQTPVCRETGTPVIGGNRAIIAAKAGIVLKNHYNEKKHGKVLVA